MRWRRATGGLVGSTARRAQLITAAVCRLHAGQATRASLSRLKTGLTAGAGVTPPVSGSHSHWVSQSELAGRANGPAEGQKDTSQARLRLLTASMRTRVNMVPSTDPRDLRARSMEAFAGVGEVQWVRLPELCFYRKNQ